MSIIRPAMNIGVQHMPSADDIAQQYALALQGAADDELDVSFMHSSLCVSGLPLRPPLAKKSDSSSDATLPAFKGRRKELSHFHRVSGTCTLSINTPTLVLPVSHRELVVGLPWGARARLLVLWITTAAQNRQDDNRWLEIGSIRSWMSEVGVPYCRESIEAVKDQLIRLSFARFTLMMRRDGQTCFKDDCLFENGVFEDQDLESFADGNLPGVRMPTALRLSDNAYRRFSGRDAIPVPTQALRTISNNSMAIDLFIFMLFRLRTISEGEITMIPWKTLISHFGDPATKSSKGQFLKDFKGSISKAVEALTCAQVDINDEGLRLHHVRPTEYRKLFAVAPSVMRPVARKRLTNRVVPDTGANTTGLNA